MNTFKAIYFKREDEKIDQLAYLNFIEKIKTKYKIPQLTPIEPLLYSGNLSNLVSQFKNAKEKLIFNTFKAYGKDTDGLKALSKSKLNFLFLDLPGLNQDTISAIIELNELNQNFEPEPQQKSPVKRKRKVNPANNKKTLKGLLNQKNIAARTFIRDRQITAQKHGVEINYTALAKALNENGYKTAKDGDFYPKTVERLILKSKQVEEYFEPNINYQNQNVSNLDLITTDKNKDSITMEFDTPKGGIEKHINFKVNKDYSKPFEVLIENNKGEKVFYNLYSNREKSVIIDINEYHFLPGQYYLNVFFENIEFNVHKRPILLRESLRVRS